MENETKEQKAEKRQHGKTIFLYKKRDLRKDDKGRQLHITNYPGLFQREKYF